jgi:hypothetical protein
MKNGVFWDVTRCGSCKNDVSEELSASFIGVTRIGELGTTLAVTSNRRTLRGMVFLISNITHFLCRGSVLCEVGTELINTDIKVSLQRFNDNITTGEALIELREQ